MEDWTLAAPISEASTVSYRVQKLHLEWDDARIFIRLRSNRNGRIDHQYSGAQATTLMTQLNKANLSISSLHKRILTQLAADGVIPSGSATGTPD